MELWIIVPITLTGLCLLGLWSLLIWKLVSRNSNLKKLLLIAILSTVLLLSSSWTIGLLYHKSQVTSSRQELNRLIQSFKLNYGDTTGFKGATRTKQVYLVTRDSEGKTLASMLVGGLWIELGEVKAK